jgi:hypothetical protein
MAQIGTFTRGDDGVFTGTIRTLNINTKATIKPVTKDTERAPDYRVTANGVEFGAGWSKASRTPAPNTSRSSSTIPPSPARSTPPWSKATEPSTSSSGRADRPAASRHQRGAAPSHPSGLCGATTRQNPPKCSAAAKPLRIIARYA